MNNQSTYRSPTKEDSCILDELSSNLGSRFEGLSLSQSWSLVALLALAHATLSTDELPSELQDRLLSLSPAGALSLIESVTAQLWAKSIN